MTRLHFKALGDIYSIGGPALLPRALLGSQSVRWGGATGEKRGLFALGVATEEADLVFGPGKINIHILS